jgi:hypothetical protein
VPVPLCTKAFSKARPLGVNTLSFPVFQSSYTWDKQSLDKLLAQSVPVCIISGDLPKLWQHDLLVWVLKFSSFNPTIAFILP